MAVGEHIHVRAVIGNAKLTRPFTPVMIEAADGIVRPHMFIRLYDCHGMSTHFSRLSAGSSLSIRGPVPTSENITRAFSGKVCVLVAGGSGIAPIFQLLQFAHVNSSYHDRRIILAQCARDHTGVWLAKEISQFASEMAGLSYHVFLSQEPHTGDSIALPVHVTCKRMGLESLRLLVPRDVANGHAVVCGPGTFNQDISSWLDRLGMEDIQVL
ncbi:ferredoxin reductase-like protein [Martensiomyces pterosporus]|nr:ferredoxin reductase-like protein [Martensiomyces pterosporus]